MNVYTVGQCIILCGEYLYTEAENHERLDYRHILT